MTVLLRDEPFQQSFLYFFLLRIHICFFTLFTEVRFSKDMPVTYFGLWIAADISAFYYKECLVFGRLSPYGRHSLVA